MESKYKIAAAFGRRNQKQIQHQVVKKSRMCMFCGERNPDLDEAGLDQHYLKTCPMLKKCEHCRQMTEISSYKSHLLTECEGAAKYKLCPRCQEPLTPKLYESHQVNRDCPPALSDKVAGRCLLCHKDVKPNNDNGWRRHLIGPNGCSGNPRKLLGIGAPAYGDDEGGAAEKPKKSRKKTRRGSTSSTGRPRSSRAESRPSSSRASERPTSSRADSRRPSLTSRARKMPTIHLEQSSSVESIPQPEADY